MPMPADRRLFGSRRSERAGEHIHIGDLVPDDRFVGGPCCWNSHDIVEAISIQQRLAKRERKRMVIADEQVAGSSCHGRVWAYWMPAAAAGQQAACKTSEAVVHPKGRLSHCEKTGPLRAGVLSIYGGALGIL